MSKVPGMIATNDHNNAAAGDGSNNNMLSINDPIFEEISRQGKPRRTSQQKKTPRVIGTNVEKKKTEKKEKVNRFAKRSNSPNSQKPSSTPVTSNAMSLSDFSQKMAEAEKPLFDFSSAAPNSNEDESVFDFANANSKDEAIFSFGDANDDDKSTQIKQTSSETPFFLAGDSTQSKTTNHQQNGEPETSSLFNFGSSNSSVVNHSNNVVNNSNTVVNHSNNNADNSKSEESLSDKYLSDSGIAEAPIALVSQFTFLQSEVASAARKVSQAREGLKSAKPSEIPAAKAACDNMRDHLISLLDQAIEMTKEAPILFKERETTTKNELPLLRKQKDDNLKTLSELEVVQGRDREALNSAKKNSEASISSLNRTYEIQFKAFSLKKQQFEASMNKEMNPVTERLAEIEQQKSKHESEIAELLRQIEIQKAHIARLDSEYEEKIAEYERIEMKYNNEMTKLSDEERALQEQRAQTDAKIKQIEAPYQSLIDTIEKRDNQMKSIIKRSQKLDSMIADSQRDTTQCSSAALIVNKLCASHTEVVKNRINTKAKIDELTSKLQQLAQVTQPKDEEIQMLKSKASRAADFIAANSDRVAQLETEKKAAIAQKNFMAAKQITQQMKDIQDQLSTAQNVLAESESKVAQYESENSQQNSLIKQIREELDDSRYEYLENDFNYYESTIAVLDGLFELSPFGEKMLKPLQSLMLTGLTGIERPPKLDVNVVKMKIAELNKKLDEVVQLEDYEAADSIQEQINKLTAKLAHA
ncbi:hypothetical protein TRFO_21840 [Tritrichomonas foetus]|uniref:UVR domain-containing protein n=1 Tax=Tritrichomonas foetus TaxID=1144522 RepID=A0A1J4KHZ7_9EUKA|nr:hypothetical protein TRFO_21840 [Tritrichomonas foetus]|eukprot:OHT09278.1 hypothetical protein TRFO_21840 [Tritrichomonas foetus]